MRASGTLILLLCTTIGLSFVSADTTEIPDLVGNWTGTSTGHNAVKGYFQEGDYGYVFSVTEQKGRIFNGTLYVTEKENITAYPYSGVISHDLKSFTIAEYGTGEDFGYLISPGEMELTLLVNEPDGFAVLCTLQKEI